MFCYSGSILIERWLPYGPQPERQTIVQPAPTSQTYPKPRHEIVVYDGIQAQTVRRFEKLGIRKENPADYVARYGPSLLDPESLVLRARNAGVHEDLVKSFFNMSIYVNFLLQSLSLPTSSSYTDVRGTYW